MLRRAPLFAAWCAADPGAILFNYQWVPALRCIAEEALHRVRDTVGCTGRCRHTARKSANKNGAARPRSNSRKGTELYLILDSLNSTCLRATGSYFFLTSLSVMVREFFLAT